jgi:apolipoprotein N-acyltransferase
MAMYTDLALAQPADLVVLPETAWTVPWEITPEPIARRLLERAKSLGSREPALAIGMPLTSPAQPTPATTAGLQASELAQPGLTNSVLLIAPGREPQPQQPSMRYDKRHLVPFGEFVPPLFSWFVRMMRIPLGDFTRGADRQPPFEIAGQRFAFNICYEDLFGEELLAAITEAPGATILVNVSNIGWFGHSHALTQHLEIARMRAIETARPMLRATNTGTTAFIDDKGLVRSRLEPFTTGALDDKVQGMTGLTPYARLGELGTLLAALAALALALGLDRKR